MARPPAQLLAAYDLDPGRLRPLRGGQGTAWSAGNLILKPLDMPLDGLAWQEQVLSHIREDGFRLARPVRALDGQLAVKGWSAWQRIEGEHLPRRWAEICAVGKRFHRASAGIPVPGWHGQRNDVFAQADLAAWDDAALSEFCSLAPVAQLAGRFRPLHGHDQLIHGDLTTNVLSPHASAGDHRSVPVLAATPFRHGHRGRRRHGMGGCWAFRSPAHRPPPARRAVSAARRSVPPRHGPPVYPRAPHATDLVALHAAARRPIVRSR
jgi:hypothetical protein